MREQRPVYVDLLPPCNVACPAGENIQAWLAHVEAGRFEDAWRTIVADNPLAAIHGRVCYHPCEDSCNRAQLDSTVSIHSIERFLGDLATEQGWGFDPPSASTGKRVLIVGAGPSGLCRRLSPRPPRPRGRDPRSGLRGGRHAAVRHPGVSPAAPRCWQPRSGGSRRSASRSSSTTVSRIWSSEQESGRFDAVFAAVGAHLAKRVDIPAQDAGPIIDAVALLRSVAEGERPQIGRRVAVYGGGNTAMDAARVAKRLGAEEAMIVYRRTREQMPAHAEEAEDAEREGVRINWLRTITAFDGPELQIEVMELDADGRPQPTGRFETLAADAVVLALGQEADTEFLRRVPGVEVARDGVVRVSPSLMTDRPGLFAGGDMVPGIRSVTVAAGHGKAAARHIDAYLGSTSYEAPPKHDTASFDKLHVWYFADAPKQAQPEQPAGERTATFDEVVGGLDEAAAVYEAKRCLSCGNCFECDGCLGACPEDAVIKLGTGNRYRFDYDLCTGCGACFEQCPVHAIDMVRDVL